MTTDQDHSESHPSRFSPENHPSPDDLLAYHEGTLPDERRDRVQEHLVVCEECSQVILDFAAFPRIEPRDESARMSPQELEDQLRELEVALGRRRPVWQRHQVLLPLAAAFFTAAVGLGAWSLSLRQTVATLRGPSADVYVATELRPDEMQTRGGIETIEVPAWSRQVVFLLNILPAEEAYDSYGVDVFAPGRGRTLTGFPVQPPDDGGFTVMVPRAALEPGEVRIELFGVRDGRRSRIATYHFALTIRET